MSFQLTISGVGSGTISPTGLLNVSAGENRTIVATPSPGFMVTQCVVTTGGVPTTYLGKTDLRLEDIQADYTIVFTFAAGSQTTYTVTPSVGVGGIISPASAVTVNSGGSANFVITASDDYYLSSVLINGVAVASPTAFYEFVDIGENSTIYAGFSLVTPASNIIRVKRGSAESWTDGTLKYGEVGFNKTNKQVRIGDVPYVDTPFADAFCITASGVGSGNVTGPAGALDRSIAVYDGVSGQFIDDTEIVINMDNHLDMAGNRIIDVSGPIDSADAATKGYVDTYIQGIVWKEPVVSIEVASPPNPEDRARYIVDEAAVGDFIGHSDEIAVWYADEETWHFLTPDNGWACYNEEIDEVMVYNSDDTSWVPIGTTGVPEAPIDGRAYCRMDADWVRTSSDGAGILALTPVNPNCLAAFNDTDGVYLKEAGRGSYVNDGFFIRTPYGTGIGEYLLKLYASRNTQTYAGILDLRTYYGCDDDAHPLIGFVSNMIKNAVASPFGGGLLINAHGPYGRHYVEQHTPNVALAVKPEGGTTVIEGLRVYESGIVECLFGVNVPPGKTYDINGSPHTHPEYFESAGGAITGVVDMSNNRITGVASPTLGSDAVNLDYVAGIISGIIWKDSVLSQVASPVEVDGRYLVAASGTSGDFVGEENNIATRLDGSWTFEDPEVGWAVSNESDNFGYCYNGTTWAKMPGAVSHSALQNLASDDHSQYVHISVPRTISAVHTFSNGFLISTPTQIANLNASYIEGASKDDFALAGHSHDFGTLLDFQVVLPASGQGLVYDAELEKFVNGDVGSGGFVIDPNHQFEDDTERDVYFATNPSELVNGVLIAVGTGFEQYDVDTWVDRTAVLRGPAGLDGRDGVDGADGAQGEAGPQGAQGVQGIQGIQGPAGASGTNINLLGSVASPADLPETATLQDAYVVESDGDLYIWGENDAWNNIGMVAGPQGPQGIEGPVGPTGTTGAAGAKGDKGDIGLTGPPGAAGPRGPSGISIGWESPVESRIASPPDNYDYNDRFLISDSPTGEFADYANDIATWLSTDQWYFDTPVIGSMVHVLEVASYYQRTGLGWIPFVSGGGGEPQVNADWSAIVGVASILNKPAIPAAQVNSDWNSTEGVTQILNKPTIPAEYVLPVATSLVLGGVKQGANVTIGVDGTISVASAETPTVHATTHVTGGTDVIADAVAAGNSGLMSGADKTKLDGITLGTAANNVVQLDANAKLPAVDGSQLTGIAGGFVKVSANDTTPGVLNGKLVAGTNITLTEGSDGDNETLTIAVSSGSSTWIQETAFTATPASTSTLTMTSDKTGSIKVGMGLKYTISSVVYYGIVTAITSNLLTVAGAPLGGDVTALYYCDTSRVIQTDFFITDKFADAADTGLLASDMNTKFDWNLGEARLVQIRHTVKTDDSGENQPRVNLSVGGSVVSTSNSNAGVAVAETWSSTVVDINTTNYVVARDAAIEVVTDANGTNADAEHLTVSGIFVLI